MVTTRRGFLGAVIAGGAGARAVSAGPNEAESKREPRLVCPVCGADAPRRSELLAMESRAALEVKICPECGVPYRSKG